MEAVATLIPARAREDGARHVRLSRDPHAINRPTVGCLTLLALYVRRTVNVKTATHDRCAWTYAAPWDDSLHAYCNLATSVAIKRERLERF